MIKRVLRAYNSGRHLVLLVLPDGKVPRLPLCQIVKQIINLVAEVLVVLPHLHLIQHVDQRRKVLPFRQQLVMDVANQGDIQQRFGLLMIGKALK